MKKIKKADQPCKPVILTEMTDVHTSVKVFCFHPKAFDHSHGRINKNPFGIDHEPRIF